MRELTIRAVRQITKGEATAEEIAVDFERRTGVKVAVSSVRCLLERLFREGVATVSLGAYSLDKSTDRLSQAGCTQLCEALTGTIWNAADGSRWVVWEVEVGQMSQALPEGTKLVLRGLRLHSYEMTAESRSVSLHELLHLYSWPTQHSLKSSVSHDRPLRLPCVL